MLFHSTGVASPDSQRVGWFALAEVWVGEKLILAEASSCLFFLCRAVCVGGCSTAIRRVSIRQVWVGRLAAMRDLAVRPMVKEMIEDLKRSLSTVMSETVPRPRLTWVKWHPWLGMGNRHFHEAVRHVRREDGTAATCNGWRSLDLELAIVIEVDEGKVRVRKIEILSLLVSNWL